MSGRMAHLYGEHIGSGVQNAAWFVVSSGRGCDGLQMQMDALAETHCSCSRDEPSAKRVVCTHVTLYPRVKQPEKIDTLGATRGLFWE